MAQRTTRLRLAPLGAAALLCAGALAACGEESTDAMGDDTAEVCQDLGAYRTALQDLGATIGPDATLAEVQTARDQAEAAHETLSESIADVTDDRTDDIRQSWDALVTAFDTVDDDATLGEAATSLRDEAQDVVNTVAVIGDDLDC